LNGISLSCVWWAGHNSPPDPTSSNWLEQKDPSCMGCMG
jgi:hypothetical protein